MERIQCDRGESPAGWRAVGPNTQLHHIFAAPTANLFLVMVSGRIVPGDAPSLDGWIPDPKRRAVHVHLLVQLLASAGARGHDPDILHGAPLEHPGGVDF